MRFSTFVIRVIAFEGLRLEEVCSISPRHEMGAMGRIEITLCEDVSFV